MTTAEARLQARQFAVAAILEKSWHDLDTRVVTQLDKLVADLKRQASISERVVLLESKEQS